MNPQVLVTVVPTSRMRIIAAAREQIESKGIMGLRVQDVADLADVSVPLIYKYFGDRDGLLAHTLGSIYDELVLIQVDSARSFFKALENPTFDDVAMFLAVPDSPLRKQQRWVSLQIMAASMEIPALRAQLGVIQMASIEHLESFFDEVQMQLVGRVNSSSRPLALIIRSFVYGFAVNDILEEQEVGVDTKAYINMMKEMFVHIISQADADQPA